MRVAVGRLREPNQLQELVGAAQSRCLVVATHAQAEGDVRAHVHVREQAVGLEDHAHVTLVRGHGGDVDIVDEQPAGVGTVEAAEDPQCGGLATARGAEQRDQLPLLDLEIQTGERGRLAEVALNPLEANHQNTRAEPAPRRRPARNESENRRRNVKASVIIESATEMPAVPLRLMLIISVGKVV